MLSSLSCLPVSCPRYFPFPHYLHGLRRAAIEKDGADGQCVSCSSVLMEVEQSGGGSKGMFFRETAAEPGGCQIGVF